MCNANISTKFSVKCGVVRKWILALNFLSCRKMSGLFTNYMNSIYYIFDEFKSNAFLYLIDFVGSEMQAFCCWCRFCVCSHWKSRCLHLLKLKYIWQLLAPIMQNYLLKGMFTSACFSVWTWSFSVGIYSDIFYVIKLRQYWLFL